MSAYGIVIEMGAPVGYQQLTVSSVAVALTVPSNANLAIITVETDNIRYRDDGTDPTAAIGIPLYVNQSLEIGSRDILTVIKFIRQSTDATLNIAYYQRK